MTVLDRPEQDVLDAFERLNDNAAFNTIIGWVKTSYQNKIENLIELGDEVSRGHCQALREIINVSNIRRKK